MTLQNKNKKINRGFTIIETMVAVSLFVVITTVGMGALLNGHLLYQKSQDMRSLVDNLNFVIEDMSRNMKTGYNYRCFISIAEIPSATSSDMSTPKSCPDGGQAIAFEYAYGDNTTKDGDPIDHDDQWVYYISNEGKIFKASNGPYALSSFTQLTSDEIFVDPDLSSFEVYGAESTASSDFKQPFVTIRLVGTVTYQNVVSPFSLQTSLSQRLVDI